VRLLPPGDSPIDDPVNMQPQVWIESKTPKTVQRASPWLFGALLVHRLVLERFHHPADTRGDVYGLGIALYEILILRPDFEDSNEAS
jgi:hypothetical protein